MEQNGTMVTVEQQCLNCCTKPFRWRSQPFILGRYPAGNILLSFATLMSGASISKVLLVFRHFGLAAYTSRTFFYHQRIYILPSILQYWENYQANLVQSLKFVKDSVWSVCSVWLGTYCRHILAGLHFNENHNRKSKKSKNGNEYIHITYPKFKLGDDVLREVPVPPTYEYVTSIKNALLT